MKRTVKTWAGLLVGAAGLVVVPAPDARACGGCFHEPTETGTVITDHRMIFSVSPTQTTLYDQIEYQGSPSSFAWVLPIHAPVTVALSSDGLFAALDQATTTRIVGPPPPACPVIDCGCRYAEVDASVAFTSPSAVEDAGAVNVIRQAVVGPYETVQLQSSDPNALDAWLAANGFVIPPDVQPIVASYVTGGFDFLALRLVPGQGVKAMRPVSVTSPGAGFTLPLRMVAAGTGATVGITLWVVGDGRWEPKNFTPFTIDPSTLVWDWTRSASNYATVRAQKEAALNGAGWQIESSTLQATIAISRLLPYSTADYGPSTDDGGLYDAGDAGFVSGNELGYLARQQDLDTLFPSRQGTARITRMRADLAHAALANDLTLQAASDQSLLSNVYTVTKGVNPPACPTLDSCNCGNDTVGGDDAGPGGSGDGSGNAAGSAASPGKPLRATGGCAAAPASPGGLDVDLVVAALAGLAFLRVRPRRARGARVS